MTPIKSIRDALYDFVAELDLSGVVDAGQWEFMSKYPPKDKPVYPGFWIQPATNSSQTLDSCSSLSTYTFWIQITQSYEDAAFAEDTTIELADAVYQEVLDSARSSTPFGLTEDAYLDATPSGSWGFDEHYGERYYRIEVAIRVAESHTS